MPGRSGLSIGSHSIEKLKESGDESVSIGALRNPSDLLADLNCRRVAGISRIDQIIQHRKDGGLARTPQLLIYRISKDSKPKDDEANVRGPLDTEHDVIGSVFGFTCPK